MGGCVMDAVRYLRWEDVQMVFLLLGFLAAGAGTFAIVMNELFPVRYEAFGLPEDDPPPGAEAYDGEDGELFDDGEYEQPVPAALAAGEERATGYSVAF